MGLQSSISFDNLDFQKIIAKAHSQAQNGRPSLGGSNAVNAIYLGYWLGFGPNLTQNSLILACSPISLVRMADLG